jgi:arachidonate 15-lipoxygenase
MLTDLVTAIIFTASAQHAALNFPQEQLESYAPAVPLAIYRPPPKAGEEPTNQVRRLPKAEYIISN